MKALKLAFTLTLVAFGTGCKYDYISTPDGRIPPEFLDQAKLIEGTYDSNFFNHTNKYKIRFEGARPILTTSRDVIAEGCDSRIGKLSSFELLPAVNKVRATFEFDSANCRGTTMGQVLKISFPVGASTEAIEISTLQDTYWGTDCSGPGKQHECSSVMRYRYTKGTLKRI